MFVREVKYYFMTVKQLNKEVVRLRQIINSDVDVSVKVDCIDALADIIKTLIRKNKKNEAFLKAVRIDIRNLQRQAYQTNEKS